MNVVVKGDTTVEGNETFFLNLSNATGATIADNQGLGTINNDDATPSAFAVNDVSMTEGNAGTKIFTFTVTRSGPTAAAASVKYNTSDGTAKLTDYNSATGTLSFAAGQATKTVNVTVKGDMTAEANETFYFNLYQATGAVISDAVGLGTIQNDDGAQRLLYIDLSKDTLEGASGTRAITFNVRLDQSSSQTVTVNFATANGTALSGSDYNATSGTLTFTPGQVAKTITVYVKGDTTKEADEKFFVNLSSPVNAAIADGQAAGIIRNDD